MRRKARDEFSRNKTALQGRGRMKDGKKNHVESRKRKKSA